MTGKFATARDVIRWVRVHLQPYQPVHVVERGTDRSHVGLFRGLRGGVLIMSRPGRPSVKWTIALTDIAEIECSINP